MALISFLPKQLDNIAEASFAFYREGRGEQLDTLGSQRWVDPSVSHNYLSQRLLLKQTNIITLCLIYAKRDFISSFFYEILNRVYKKTSSNQLLTLYLGTRELTARAGLAESLKGVIYIDPKLLVSGHKVYGQLTLTFR